MDLLKLAERFAELKSTKILASFETGENITFVLESGPKLRMNRDQLEKEIAQLTPAVDPLAEKSETVQPENAKTFTLPKPSTPYQIQPDPASTKKARPSKKGKSK